MIRAIKSQREFFDELGSFDVNKYFNKRKNFKDN